MFSRAAQALMIGGAIFLSMVVAPGAAFAEKRVALVIGNSGYQSVAPLPNPARDAESVAKLFREAKFDSVDVKLNLGIIDFKRTIRRFEDTADQADVAVIYYAGHGLEINGSNYLIPVDAKLANDRDAEDEAIALDRVLSSAGGAKKFRLIILDACRDNPFKAGMKKDRKSASRGISTLGGVDLSSTTDTLTAYAAKLGSTAEDGDGDHSPFTAALLKNLTVPGLDVRMAFGRIKKEVMSSTGGRQEPFVYGSLGDDNYSLVPAPVTQEASTVEMKADFDLISSINTKRAWEVFLSRYKTGPYADRARQQLASLSEEIPPQPPATSQGNPVVGSLPPNVAAPGREPSSQETLEWNKVKDSTDPSALVKFIQRFPNSPFAVTAQQRMDVLKRAAQEREERDHAAAKAAEQARIEAAQKKAEQAAAQKREEDERRAKAAEAEQQARAAEAERRAAEAKQRADEAQRNKAATEAAALRAESENQAREAEEARRKAELASAQETTCKQEQGRFEQLNAKGSEGSGTDDLRSFAKTVSCDRLRPQVVATLDRFNADAAKRAAALPNSLELVRAAQAQLARLGCFTGKIDGSLTTTQTAVGHYFSVKGKPSNSTDVTEGLVADLTKQTDRVCPLECYAGEVAKGDICVATDKPTAAPATASRRKNDDADDKPAARKQQPKREAEAPRPRPAPEAPRARQQAAARPMSSGGGGGGGGGGGAHTMVGVGF
jgi:hypothetical protein